ncbi:hypothetical protein HYC85_012082 [Camellia sinensis]|uniref:Uncharacterized protein n=1 Tax=Camellia sinensis TaxID=4442 RepID=A0A7J7HBG5_CAMSI|nr:hypothetical protein HYC85_012082 [Camellia sinensis]
MYVGEPVIFIPIALFAIYNLYTLSKYLRIGLSTRAWWNNQRIWRLNTMIAWLFGVLGVLLKLLRLSDTIFEVTQKDQSTNADDNNANAGRFTFEGSPSFVLGTTILLVNLTALAIGLSRFQLVGGDGNGSGIGEFICSDQNCWNQGFSARARATETAGTRDSPLERGYVRSSGQAILNAFLHFASGALPLDPAVALPRTQLDPRHNQRSGNLESISITNFSEMHNSGWIRI